MKSIQLFLAAALISSAAFSSCLNEAGIQGNGDIITKTLTLDAFSGIDVGGPFHVNITQGNVQEVTVKGHSNIIEQLDIKVKDSMCRIDLKKGRYKNSELNFEVVVPDLDRVSVSGAGDITVGDFKEQGDLDVSISGSGEIILNQFSGGDSLNLSVSGSGDIVAKGSFDDLAHLNISISGSGSFDGPSVEAEDCNISIAGSGDCKIGKSNNLAVNIVGSGSIYYKGSPEISRNIIGSGDIVDAN